MTKPILLLPESTVIDRLKIAGAKAPIGHSPLAKYGKDPLKPPQNQLVVVGFLKSIEKKNGVNEIKF